MPNTWTIHADGVTGGKDKADLVGCHINVNAAGTAYQFTQPNITNVLSTTDTTSLPTPPFDFPNFPYQNFNWDISVDTLTGGPSNNQAQGTWTNDDPSIAGEEDGTWVGQVGGHGDEDEDEGASSAYA